MGFIQGVGREGMGTRIIWRFFRWALRRYRRRLEARIHGDFDRVLSLKLDALSVLLDE